MNDMFPTGSTDLRVVDKAGLWELNKIAEEHGYNRLLNNELFVHWDESKEFSVGWVVMLHEHAGGELVPPHYRTSWTVGCIDDEGKCQTVEVTLDVPISIWEKLRTIEDAMATKAKEALDEGVGDS